MTENFQISRSTFKIVFVGDGGVGKTTMIHRILTDQFSPRYISTVGVEVHPLIFETTRGRITFNVWDTAGQEKLRGLADGYYHQSDAAILMYDVNSRVSFRNLANWRTEVQRVCPNIPILIVANKIDTTDKVNHPDSIRTSVRMNQNIRAPFLQLARILMRDSNLDFV